ncbi:dihydrolipoyl dehydrogenase [Persicimonas caeni]|uniref:Dihydrolipoyl dehydrogenase n=1 Tax=Persicimonas caeni TaxID=2292766 RepID=A0A4Y6PYZ0_PERCE|nr:dihydrolipoyl dehydrogenase [Persicimonas caeni]QDG53546.1 dihydrolipoyl dehydrogenase [Persicimonas caeni]QED34767.1 dihydrolipoyl dehydrogenase [Persicimonas caeni]
MKTKRVDVAIIGAGTAGLNARREAEKAGASWVLIESGPYGTTCARVGCMPSKLLIAAAEAAHNVAHAREFGVNVENWNVDGRAVMERVRSERDRFVGFVVDSTESIPEEKRLRGEARFVGPKSLQVGDHTRVEAKSVVIATGSRPWIPPQLDAIRDDVLVNDDVFEWEDLPESMAIFGTGIIGLEIGQALTRLGVQIEFFNPFDELGRFSDPKIVAKAHKVFGKQLTLHLKSDATGVEKVDGGYRIQWTDLNGEDHERVFQHVMSAAGRRPNVEALDLEKAGIPLDHRGLPISDPRTLQCGDTSIFVAGDVSGHRPILHEASDEGRIAGANAAQFPDVQATVRKTSLEIAFTEPQMAIVGERYIDLDPDEIAIGEVSYDNQGRARVMGANCGLVRLYGRKSNCRLIAAEMFGPRVEHTSHLLAWAIQEGLTVPELLEKPVYHPVFEEGIRTAIRNLAKELRVSGQCGPQDRGEGPGA